tara:strand:- start:75 stop:503 length:429 start_codon:yes stop_codon:yes gene_type:complete
MPNWTTNEVTITAESKKDLTTFMKQIKSKNNPFDFDKIEPMPKNLFMGNLGREEERKYGKNNWYHWSIENWGTKWNSCSTMVERLSPTEVFYQFDTAWSPPLRIWEAILNIYSGQVKGSPKIKIEWHCLDEDDSTCGDGYFL